MLFPQTAPLARVRALFSVFCAAAAACALSAHAQAPGPLSPDLQEIADAGEVVIGVREDAMPFAFVDQDGRPKGYAVDICNRVVENLRKQLNRPDLRVRYNTVTVGTRQLLVREKVVDLECGATSNTRERAQDFDFSVAYGIEQAQMISPTSQPANTRADLQGQKVLVTTGSTSERWLRAQPGTPSDVVPVRNAGRAFFELQDKKARAYIGSGEVFLGEVLRRGGQTSDFKRVTLTDSAMEPLAVMMRKNRPGLKQATDDTIRAMAKSGELVSLYSKWFEAPMSARRVALAQPMSTAWREMVNAPNDAPAN